MKQVVAALTLGCVGLALSDAPCAAGPEVSLQAVAEGDGEYMIGEPIFVTLTFRGESDDPVTVDLGHLGRQTLLVTTAGGTHTSGYLETCPGGLSPIYEATLERGDTYQHRILLNEWLPFTQPGEHRVAVTYDSARWHTQRATEAKAVCELTLPITPKDREQLTELLRQTYDTRREAIDTLALCYSGQDEALPFLRALIQEPREGDSATRTEPFKGIRRVGTLAALDLLANLMKSPEGYTRHMAMVEVGLMEREAADPKVKARAQELMKQIPEGFTFAEPAIRN